MKITKIILFFVLGISSLTFAQTLNSNLHEANALKPVKNNQSYNPNLIYLDANKLVDLPVDGAFLYSSLDPESGIIASGYNNNEDYTLTIKNQYNRRIFLRSHYFSSENINDVLTIYDGQDTTALELKSLSGYLDENFAIMSSGEYLTLRFRSNNSTTSKGFRFRLDNGPGTNAKQGSDPLPNPMACASTPAANECVNAPLICDLNGYCGNTSGAYTAGNTSGLGNFCGSIENNSWLSFVASSTSASLNFNSGGCQDNSSGIQAVIYASSNCTSFTEVSNCVSQGSGSGTFTITTNVNLVPGQTYYVMIDGFGGNVCSYTVGAQSGVALGQQITGPSQVCPGQSATLGASSTASSYNWSSTPPGVYPNTQTITITPTVTTTYTLTMGASACTPTGVTIVKTVTVTNTLSPANITAPPLVCYGSNVSLTSLTNGGTYVWTGPAGFTSNVQSPTINNWSAANNGSYSLTINYGGGCATTPTAVTINGVAAPVINIAVAPSMTICAGQAVTLTASGGSGTNPYTWNWNFLNTSAAIQTCALFVGCSVNPLASSLPGITDPIFGGSGPSASFTLSATDQLCASSKNGAGCIGTKCVTITVLPAAAALTISPTSTICPGGNTSLTVSGGTTYTWSPAATLSSPNGATVTASPTVTTVYTVSTTVCGGTISTKTVQVVVNGTPPAIGAIAGPTVICANSTGITYSVTNVASTSYTWTAPAGATITSGVNTNVITVNFGSSAGTVSVIAVGTCGTATAAVNVSLSPPLSLTVTPNTSTVCAGSSTTLTASGATTYTWSPAATLSSPNGTNVTATPLATTVYTVIGSTGTCTGSTTSTVTVGGALTLTVTPNTSTVCPGTPVTLTASGATNYTWSPAATLSSANGTTVSATPAVNTTYTVLGATGTCTGTATAIINIGGSLTLTVTPNTSTVCPGTPVLLTASGATNYTWSPAATLSSANGATVNATPAAGTTYTVIGTSGTCTGSATANISMSAGLTLTLTSNTPTICPNGAALLDANGATTYTWFPSASLSSANGSNVTASPLVNTTYTVLGSTGTCTGVATVNIGIGVCVSSACDLALIRSTLTSAGNIELLGMNNTCSLYFINPQYMTGPQAQAYAQTFGANLISVQSASENTDLVQALANQGYAANVIWIGYSDAITEGSYVWYDGAPLSYSNWAPGEPNNAGDEDCTQIYADGSWNDLACGGYNSLSVIEVNICPQVSVVNVPPTHCPFTNVTMNASTLLGSPNYTYTWVQSGTSTFTTSSTGTSLNDQITVTSMGANTFTVYTEDRYSCPQSTTVSLNVFPTPTITANSATICAGQETATLTANGATTYSWIPGTGLNATSGAVVTGTPLATQNYTVIGMDANGCMNGTITSIFVNPIPNVTASQNVTICPGDATVLTASGTTSYTWSPAISLSSANGSSVTATPTAPTIYTVQGSSANGCIGTGTVSVHVSNNGFLPSVYIIQKNSLCDTNILSWVNITSVTPTLAQGNLPSGITVNATHSNGGLSTTPSMFNGASFPVSYSVPIASTTIRNDLGGTFNFCFSQPVINPQIAFASIGTVGVPITINTSVPYQVLWTGTNMTYVNSTSMIGAEGFTIVRFPGVHTCLSLNYIGDESYCNLAFGVMDAACQGQPICPGTPVELIGNGATSYTWNTGANTTTITPAPSTTTTYSLTGANSDGCVNTAVTTVTVNPTPTITVNSSTICVGQQTATLTANGADTYTWSPGTGLSTTTGSVVTGTPVATQNYTVTGTDTNGCINDTTTSITVNTLPVITANSATICVGQQTATLTANGATTYSWIPGTGLSATTGSMVTGTPTVTQNYTVAGMDANGCINGTLTAITVNPLPTITANSSTICVGQQTATLSANGATTYTWSPGTGLNATTGSVVTGTPIATQNYTVTGTDTNGCINDTTASITVNTLPVITANSATICVGQQTATLTANGATTYSWIPGTGLSATTGSIVTGTPTVTQNYTVAGMDANGCISGTITAITVNPLPAMIASPNLTVCPLSANTLTVSGAASYTWSPNIYLNTNTSSSVISTPSLTTTYTIDGESTVGCTSSTVMTIVVANTVVVNATAGTATICPLASTSLTAIGATTYTWSPPLTLSSANGATVTATPPTSTTYTVIGSTSTCTDTMEVVVTVTVNPTISVASNPANICSGNSAVLTANGASTYTWSPSTALSSTNSAAVNANPTVTTVYNIAGTSPLGCLGSTTTTLTVVTTPTVSVTANSPTICAGNTSTLTAIGATGYTWSPSGTVSNVNGSPTIATPALTTTYTVNGNNSNAFISCPDTKTVVVVVIPNPTLTPGSNMVICEGKTTLIYATGASTYTWSPTTGVAHIHDSTTNVTPPLPGVFIYTVTGTTNNCSSSTTVEVTVNALPIINAGVDTTVNIDNTITLMATGDTQVGFIYASSGVVFECNYCPTVTVNPQESTCYTVEGISAAGCRNTDDVCVTVTKDWDVFFPNAFTPNGDINNEVFFPVGYGIDKIQLQIFDRWGHLIYKAEGQTVGWDGTNKGKLCEQGVYIYKAEVTAMSGEKRYKTGHVTLLGKAK
ncbi:MAG: gliding motility-associated C-terminal domain-containing protein [Bacteroidota bacterium]